MPPLNDLFREIILDHYRSPRHKHQVDGATDKLDADNPLCGDEITLELRVKDGKIEEAGFTGRGCSISQASASMMCDQLVGMTQADANVLAQRFRSMLIEGGPTDGLGDLEALQGVSTYPVRVKCATLGWNALLQMLGHPVQSDDEGPHT